MSTIDLQNVTRYLDTESLARGEPGLRHSWVSSLATVLHHITGSLDPVELMGATGFAFRFWVSEVLCPSAQSVFAWQSLLPESVEQTGYHCSHITRFLHEMADEEAKRQLARTAIQRSLERDIPVIAWDIADAEWGVICGCNEPADVYHALDWKGDEVELPAMRLGRNGIDNLSIVIVERPNSRTQDEIFRNALHAAVQHAHSREELERPAYADGLAAFEMLKTNWRRWAMLIDAGKAGNIGVDLYGMARYCISHVFSARCYARDYLERHSGESKVLKDAAEQYGRVASSFGKIWTVLEDADDLSARQLRDFSEITDAALEHEKKAVKAIESFLAEDV